MLTSCAISEKRKLCERKGAIMKIALGLVLFTGLGLATAANAAIADFEGVPIGVGTCGGPVSSGGLEFSGTILCTLGPSDFLNWPAQPASNILASGFGALTVTKTGGGTFNLTSFDAQNGTYNPFLGSTTSIVVTGNLVGGGTLNTILTVGDPLAAYTLNWNNLTSVVFSEVGGGGYTGFDNFNYRVGGVPEPANWALLIAGFGLVGAAMRRRSLTVA
jgi:hypothetical protein